MMWLSNYLQHIISIYENEEKNGKNMKLAIRAAVFYHRVKVQ